MMRFEPHASAAAAVAVLLAAAVGCCLGGCQPQGQSREKPHSGRPGALIVTTDFETGSFAVVKWGAAAQDESTGARAEGEERGDGDGSVALEGQTDRRVWKSVAAIHSDAACRFDPIAGLPFVIARLGANVIDVVDPDEHWQVVKEYSVEAGEQRTNPQDIAVVSPERAFVARKDQSELLVVHPTRGTVLDSVDLSSYADDDEIPDATWMVHIDGKVYVLLARLDNFQPTDHSALAIVDGESGQVQEALELSATNPFGKLRYYDSLGSGQGSLLIIESGEWGELDGGLELFDPVDNTLSGLMITEQILGGDMVDAVLVSERKGYAIIGVTTQDGAKTQLVSFDPSAGELSTQLLASEKWTYAALELNPEGTELWVADRSRDAPGVRIFDVQTDRELTDKPLDTGLPPFMICFVP